MRMWPMVGDHPIAGPAVDRPNFGRQTGQVAHGLVDQENARPTAARAIYVIQSQCQTLQFKSESPHGLADTVRASHWSDARRDMA